MKRSNRLVAMTNYFLTNPYQLIRLSHFSEKYASSKSSISEDLDIINDMFKFEVIGYLRGLSGESSAAMYLSFYSKNKAEQFPAHLWHMIEDSHRTLAGGYLYMSDILGDPKLMRKIGHIFASAFSKLNSDVVMTVATKGISVA